MGSAAADSRPIPTPWRVRWSLFRSRWLPVVTVAACASLSVWLWARQAAIGQAIGEVETIRVTVSSVVEGRLDYVDGRQVTLLQQVEEGDVLARLDDAAIKSQIATAQAELKLLEEQLRAATAGGNQPPTPANTTVEALRTAVTAKQEYLAQLDLKLDSLLLRAPITGTVTRIYRRPGQFVAPGQPLLDIASDRGLAVVSYLRAENRVLPRQGMEVELRLASDPYRPITARVDSVASQFEEVPVRQLRDPKVPEWGVPVRVTLPPDLTIRPGELVRLSFRPRSTGTPPGPATVAQQNPDPAAAAADAAEQAGDATVP